MPDQSPVGRWGRISDHAMQAMLARHSDRIIPYLRERIPVHLRGTVGPEDLFQEVCAAAWSSRETFRSVNPSSFDRWIRAITDRKLLDLKKWAARARRGGDAHKRSFQSGNSDSGAGNGWIAASRTPSRDAAAREAAREMKEALAQLPADLRMAFLLCEIEGQSPQQAAAAMGRTPAAVRSLLYRGREKLRSLIGDPRRFFSDSGVVLKGRGDTARSARRQ